MDNEDRIDRYCNQIHITCIGLQRLKKKVPYRCDRDFVDLVERFCRKGQNLMELIRSTEGQIGRAQETLYRYAGLNPL